VPAGGGAGVSGTLGTVSRTTVFVVVVFAVVVVRGDGRRVGGEVGVDDGGRAGQRARRGRHVIVLGLARHPAARELRSRERAKQQHRGERVERWRLHVRGLLWVGVAERG
jgi:hypothetical protein